MRDSLGYVRMQICVQAGVKVVKAVREVGIGKWRNSLNSVSRHSGRFRSRHVYKEMMRIPFKLKRIVYLRFPRTVSILSAFFHVFSLQSQQLPNVEKKKPLEVWLLDKVVWLTSGENIFLVSLCQPLQLLSLSASKRPAIHLDSVHRSFISVCV
jgi:hypothetical protein